MTKKQMKENLRIHLWSTESMGEEAMLQGDTEKANRYYHDASETQYCIYLTGLMTLEECMKVRSDARQFARKEYYESKGGNDNEVSSAS